VDPSISVNRNVTVPVGKARMDNPELNPTRRPKAARSLDHLQIKVFEFGLGHLPNTGL
jgi:hypothetical protein